MKVEGGESRRAFLKGVAMTGAFSMMSAASAKGGAPGGQSNPIVPNAPENGGTEFQVPRRPMGNNPRLGGLINRA